MATLYQISILCFNLLFFFTSLTLANTQTPTPFEAKWSSATFGPDGPWQAVSVTLGADTDLALYPGHTFQSWIIQTSYCKFNNSNGCYASKAGTYNSAEASQVGSGSTSGIVFRPHIKNWMIGIDPAGESAQFWVDRIRLKSGTSDAVQQVENTSLALLEDQMLTYPGGQWYPAFAGCLGVGAPNMINQSFSTGTYPINASLIPGMLWTQQDIPSNSFSMHIGSVWSRIGGSLIFGGYDQNRLTGEVLVSEGDYTDNPITLRDISIEVIQGISPFNFTTQDGLRQDGLLAAGNNSIQNGLLVSIDGCAPYLTLPKSTCDNIASHLPVTYDTNLGLYLWDTESTAYTRIVSSASTLSFTFLSGTNTEPLTIRVPFLHLNLTLSEPLTAKPTPYFPCFNSGSGRYALGRAFLQDAFLGANWGQSKWWLGQAPGPNIQLSSSVVAIEEAGTVIKAGNNDWEESWKGIWKVLGPDSDSGTSPTESPTDNRQPTSAPASTISTGAIAGIAVGGVAVVIALGLGVVFWRRRNRRGGRASTMKREPPQHKHDSLQYGSRPPPQTEPAEVYGSISIYKWRNRNGKQIDSPEDPRISRVELP
ncbi:aspartic peptidase domain-containing protein [Colletotrichum phormii]|uniref:Aspartic peptidase domain-containing protein n=1 Tax=Colletotrichum phormii TaxID=359342 RepID=A0AAJ0A0R6_9PEZI|nr:aspartic peptidase domain-containing protein [Colletotrichum phormii]KAK1640349.1 aspartic peptidase domain-containing protein [Colletotrichum phormii]